MYRYKSIEHRSMGTSNPNVQVKEAVLITPSEPTPTHNLKLSAIDSQLFLRFTIEYLLIYDAVADRTTVTARVKDALARALVPYYPLAGRVRARPDGSSLEVVCRGQGAVFVEATGDFTAGDFQTAPRHVTDYRKLLALEVSDVLTAAPALVIQLTWLSDSSVALAAGFSHCICDGIGSVEFLHHFSDLASGRRLTGPKPIWERHLLETTPFRMTTSQPSHHPEFNRVPDVCKFLTRFNSDQLTPTSTTFDEWRINELKSFVGSPSGLGPLGVLPFTTFEVLSAHIWRSWARAINFPAHQTLKLLFSINVRNIIKPSLPRGFYGNAIVLGCAQTTMRELTEKGLGFVIELIREAKDRVDDGFVREVVDSVSLTQASQVPDSVGVLILSQWSKVGLENVDFGLGRPVQVGPVCTDKYCILLPVRDHSRSVKSVLAVPSVAVDKFEYMIRAVE